MALLYLACLLDEIGLTCGKLDTSLGHKVNISHLIKLPQNSVRYDDTILEYSIEILKNKSEQVFVTNGYS